MQVLVRDNNVEQASRCLRRRCSARASSGDEAPRPLRKALRAKSSGEGGGHPPRRKLARKKLQREGLLPMKPRLVPGAPGKGGPARIPRF